MYGEEKEYLIDNLSMLLASGMNVTSSLDAIAKDLKSERLKKAVSQMEADIASGANISTALEKSGIVSDQIVALIRIGEETGKLAENLKVVVSMQKKERSFNSKIRSAVLYPTIVLSMAVVLGVGISWFILPRLALVFEQLDIKLPFITRVLINTGSFLGQYGVIVVPLILLGFGILGYFIFVSPAAKSVGQRLLFVVPGVKKLILEVEVSRMGYLLGTLLDVGTTIVIALTSLGKAASFYAYRDFYQFLRDRVEEGNSFQKSFDLYPNASRLIPTPVQQLMFSGEKSGNLPSVLLRIGETYEEKVETTMKDLATIIEPILLIIVWLGVVAVALSVVLPIYSLIGGLNK